MAQQAVEPWLRGPLEGVHPLVMPLFFSFAQVREDLARFTRQVSPDAVWRKLGAVSLGFHLKHLAFSVDRLTTYLMGGSLSKAQLAALGSEHEPDLDLPALLALVDQHLRAAEERLRQVDPERLYEPRTVGRRALPTTVIGLLVHIAEHTQRHLGQAIGLAQLLK
jgi:uncharacterized damage-inducible protein DinB